MIPDPEFWLAAIGLVVACLSATAARSLAEFSPHELEEICRRGKASDRLGKILKDRDQVALGMETLRVVAVVVMVAAATVWSVGRLQGPDASGAVAVSLGVVAATLGVLAVVLWIPWAISRLWANPFLYHFWPLLRTAASALVPLVLAGRFVDVMFHRLAGRTADVPDEESFEEDIRTIVSEGHREGLLEEDAREMIEGVIELGDIDVSEVMTPRTEMVSMPRHLSWQEAMDFVVSVGHTRIPVTDKNRDDIVGILVTKDLLPELAKGPDEPVRPWTDLLREPYFVPETKPIDVLLEEFQQTRSHLAVVLDEYGGVSGLVTIEDVLEEIVGEIIDEYDKDLVDGIREVSDGVCEALGKVHVDEINERLDLTLPDDGDFDTIGGYVFSELGHIPVVGEELARHGVRITVLEATPRRIERVRVEVLDQSRRETA